MGHTVMASTCIPGCPCMTPKEWERAILLKRSGGVWVRLMRPFPPMFLGVS